MSKRETEETVEPPPEYDVDAAILRGVKSLRIERRKVPPPAAEEVQVTINCVGICGSDMAYWAKGVAGGFLELDFSEDALCKGYEGRMGHECAGTVRRVGARMATRNPQPRCILSLLKEPANVAKTPAWDRPPNPQI
eukprot:3080044-Amphidinium_carterae.1